MLQAIAILLTLNGVQVDLPAPALLIDDYSYVPVRAVFEHLGWIVMWDFGAVRVELYHDEDPPFMLTLGQTTVLKASPLQDVAVGIRQISGRYYVQLQIVTALTGLEGEWDLETGTLKMDNGIYIKLPTSAQVLDHQLYVPLRAVFEQLGWTVRWAATFGLAVEVCHGGKLPYLLDGRGKPETLQLVAVQDLPVTPRMINGRLYVPVRAVTAVTGAQAKWDARTRTVNLRTSAPRLTPAKLQP